METSSKKENVAVGGAFVAGGAIGVVAAPAVTVAAANAVGFTATGVAAGSIAASAQPATIVAGGIFASLQSIGATGGLAYLGSGALLVLGAGALLGAVVVGGAAVGSIAVSKHLIKQTAREELPLTLELCDSMNHSEITKESIEKLESYIRALKRHWKGFQDFVEGAEWWDEPRVGLGKFKTVPSAQVISDIRNELSKLMEESSKGNPEESSTPNPKI